MSGTASTSMLKPQFIDPLEGERLIQMLRQGRTGCTAVQFLAATRGVGVSSVTRDLALIAGAGRRLATLLLPGGPEPVAQGRCSGPAAWPKAFMDGEDDLLPARDVPWPFSFARIRGLTLVVATSWTASDGFSLEWPKLLSAARSKFDLVIVDGPASDVSYTGFLVAPHVDANVVVVAAEETRNSAAAALCKRINDAGGEIAGVILNKHRPHLPAFLRDRL